MGGRRLLVPEVVQTSAMDCGPAALACLLGGFGVSASYGRLREACQTDVDGTSIDALEDTARLLGLDAEQVMMPVDHLLVDEAGALPALVVTRLPSGLTHFVVAWRRHGRLVQVMDPAVGRRWVKATRFLHDVYVHEFSVPADAFCAWAMSDAFLVPVGRSLAALGVRDTTVTSLIERARAEEGWRGVATLDAAARLATSLVDAGGLRRGADATALIERLLTADGRAAIPESSWFARAGAEEGEVAIRGAVLVRVPGLAADPPSKADLPCDLQAALEETPPRPARIVWNLLTAQGGRKPLGLAGAALVGGVGTVAEALLFRGVINAATQDSSTGSVAVLLAAAVGLLAVEAWLAAAALGLGRDLEGDLRGTLLRRLPRMPDAYFRSRPVSDLSERAHRLHQLRQLPTLGAELVRAAAEVVAITVGIVVVDPASAVPAVLGAVVAVGAGLVMQPTLSERDLRLRSHSGATARFYLDGLLGLAPVRAHSAEWVVEAEHGRLLREWSSAARAAARTVVTAEAVQAVLGVAVALWLVVAARDRAGEPATFLLLAYWALALPVVGQRIGLLARQYPSHRNTTLRFLEPLSSPQDAEPVGPQAGPAAETGADIRFENVRVLAGGQAILDGIDLHIASGSRVAVVGATGAGKSSLVGVLLGWHRPAEGEILVDGSPLDPAGLERLRRATAWVDPAVTVWNRSMRENLTYGQDGQAAEVAAAIEDADLASVVSRLPEGLDEPLGEGGGLLSGGEAQRVRLARARLRPDVRLVVLDEPFRGLDHGQRRSLLARSQQWWPGATVILVTHDVADTEGFDRILVVEHGHIVEDGAPADLAAREESRYRALVQAQEDSALASEVWRRLWVEDGKLTGAESRR
jgi:ATP-binding cassette subfamily B protein